MQIFKLINIRVIATALMLYKIIQKKGELIMMRLLAKMAEKYAKSTNTACMILWWGHQPKMPASLIKKD